jgi:hypothetical protein
VPLDRDRALVHFIKVALAIHSLPTLPNDIDYIFPS